MAVLQQDRCVCVCARQCQPSVRVCVCACVCVYARATVCQVYTRTHQELCVGEHHMEMLCTYKLQTSQARPSTSKGSRNEF